MEFGKNRVQFMNFYWQYYRFDKFDTYFYVGGNELAQQTSIIANKKIKELESMFDYSIEKRILFIVYNKHSDFKQSNIGLSTGSEDYNIGGVTKIIGNKVFIFNEGDRTKLEKQISGAIAEVIINEMLYGADLKDKIANSALISLPEWYTKGLISFLSCDWDINIENRIKDGILSRKFEQFNKLSGSDAVYAGHSIWNFIAAKYGKSVIPNIVYLTRISKNVESGFIFVIGTTLKFLSYDWINYYDSMFYEDDKKREKPNPDEFVKLRGRKINVYQNAVSSPDGKYTAYTGNILGKYRIWLINNETGKQKRIYSKEHKLEQITDFSYPIIEWYPNSSFLSFITEQKGKLLLNYYFIETGKIEERQLFNLEKILSFSYSHDGKLLLISGIKNGYCDLFVLNLASNNMEQITEDISDEHNPRFINNSSQIVFSSNRINDTIRFKNFKQNSFQKNHDIFIYDYKTRNPLLTRFTNTPNINEKQAFQFDKSSFVYLDNTNGIINRQYAIYDSVIAYIDTTTHYRYFSKPTPITNYKRNILGHNFNKNNGEILESMLLNGRYYIIKKPLDINFSTKANIPTVYRNKQIMEYNKLDSLDKLKNDSLPILQLQLELLETMKKDSSKNDTTIDINNYIFEKERLNISITNKKDSSFSLLGNENPIFPRQRVYFTAFYPNLLVNQLDFSFINNSYQTFTGGAGFFNPKINMLFKIGSHDLFEDYRITGGMRFAGNLESNEYLVSIENLKKRTDHQLVFHRQGFTNRMNYPNSYQEKFVKTTSYDLNYIASYPFSQVAKIRLSTMFRYDYSAILATEYVPLNEPSFIKTWAGLKAEYVFDNTRKIGLNSPIGTRFKFFAETYKQLNKAESDLWVTGADFRHYIKIHRCLIWANRFAGSISGGSSKLVYYLGSVDNWIKLTPKIDYFDTSIPVDSTNYNYGFQALATNMRGFIQNVRNGTKFALINSELRWPIIKYFANRPINSDFLENLQIVGFFDVGTAWNGNSPKSKENAYQTQVIRRPNLTIIIDKELSPLVYGYGFGVRTKLLGYFIRADWAWGIEKRTILDGIFYLSLSLDF
ncbi:MAG: hypothetical protein JXR58_11670 [Bacteroidales bacterium]|nr:hypothetical protein [Bacteroidales bacterium]